MSRSPVQVRVRARVRLVQARQAPVLPAPVLSAPVRSAAGRHRVRRFRRNPFLDRL